MALSSFAHRRAALPSWLTSQPVAHRGLHSASAPENTLAAFEAARDANYPIELDAHVLRDGTVVVFHDDDLARAAHIPRSLDEESRDTIGQYALFGTTQTIPTLAQVFACVGGKVPILLELKSRKSQRQAPHKVIPELARYRGEVAVQSFDPYALAVFRTHEPHYPRGQLAGPLENNNLTTLERFASRHLLSCALSRPHFLNYDLRALPDRWVDMVRSAFDLPLLAWTVRSESDRQKAEQLGVNYVFDHVRP